jgi:hypothetical protein
VDVHIAAWSGSATYVQRFLELDPELVAAEDSTEFGVRSGVPLRMGHPYPPPPLDTTVTTFTRLTRCGHVTRGALGALPSLQRVLYCVVRSVRGVPSARAGCEQEKNTPLHYAAYNGHVAVCSTLVRGLHHLSFAHTLPDFV